MRSCVRGVSVWFGIDLTFAAFLPSHSACLALPLSQGHWGRYACAPGAGEVTSGTRGRFEIPSYAGFNKMQLA